MTSADRRQFSRRLATGTVALTTATLGLSACSSRLKLAELPELPKNAGRQVWRYASGNAGVGFVPVHLDSKIWVASRSGEITGLNAVNGQHLLDFQSADALASGLATDSKSLLVVDTEGHLIATDLSGKQRWRTNLEAEPLSVPAVGSGLAILRLSNSTVAAFDVQSGKRRWLYSRRNPSLVLRQTSSIALDLNNAYVGLPGGRVVALTLSSGASRWESGVSVPRGANEIERIADVVGTPVLAGDTLCAAAYQGSLTCIDAHSGRAIWSKRIGAGAGIDVDRRRMVVSDTKDRITAFSRSNIQLWQQEAFRGRRLGAPLLMNNRVWVGDAGGAVHILDAQNGQVIGRVETDGSPIDAQPLAVFNNDEPFVVVQTRDGSVVAVTA